MTAVEKQALFVAELCRNDYSKPQFLKDKRIGKNDIVIGVVGAMSNGKSTMVNNLCSMINARFGCVGLYTVESMREGAAAETGSEQVRPSLN